MFGELLPRGGGDPIPLLQKKLLIGRRSSCDIVLEFPNVSSHHCELELIEGHWQIRDLNSSNGVKVNGERCVEKWLAPGDEISVATHHFVISYQPTGDIPLPAEEVDPFALSLLEKAGLQRRQSERRRNPPPPPSQKPGSGPQKFSDEEDSALQWLNGD